MSHVQTPSTSMISPFITRLSLLSVAVMAGILGGLFMLNFGALLGGSVGRALAGNNGNYVVLYFGVFGGYIGTPVGAALGTWAMGSARHRHGSFWAALAGAVLCAIAGLWIFGGKLSFYNLSPELILFALLSAFGALLGFELSRLGNQRRGGASNTASSIGVLSCFVAAGVGGAIGGIVFSLFGSWFGQAIKGYSYDAALYSVMVSGYLGTIVGAAIGVWGRQQQLNRRSSFGAALAGAALCAIGGILVFGGDFFIERSALGSVLFLAPLCATGAVLGLRWLRLEKQDGAVSNI